MPNSAKRLSITLVLATTFAVAALSSSAFAYTTQCWRCVGGWCCY